MRINTRYLNKLFCIVFIMALVSISGCRKFIETSSPENAIAQENVYSNDNTSASVLSGIYNTLSSSSGEGFGLPAISKWAGLSADEFELWTGADIVSSLYFSNNLAAPASLSNSAGHEFWGSCYSLIYVCNSAIEGINASNSLSPSIKKQLLGEAKFLRAFLYYYLTSLYGELPLVISTDPEVNKVLGRSSVEEVYKLIVDDLSAAKELLSSDFVNRSFVPYTSAPERVRPTKWAASALLARVFLSLREYSKAEAESTIVINNTALFTLPALSDVFLKNSKEAIWQLQPVMAGWNTEDSKTFNLAAEPVGFSRTKPVYVSQFLLSAFEAGDNRKVNWLGNLSIGNVTYYFPNKYKNASQNADITSPSRMSEYRMVLRLAEQYLIRAESRTMQNNISGATEDLNLLRVRARMPATNTIPNPLPAISSSVSQQELSKIILKERQVELFSEWGHRWLDLKRSGTVDMVMSQITPLKGGVWQPTDQLYPIPYGDIQKNPSLQGHQNPGY